MKFTGGVQPKVASVTGACLEACSPIQGWM